MFIAIKVKFERPTYRIDEGKGPLYPVLVFSNPSSFDITVRVRSMDSNATGKINHIM